MKRFLLTTVFTIIFCGNLYPGFFIDLESGGALPGYNDVRIPNDLGTRFSLKKDIENKPTVFFRFRGGFNFMERHSVAILIAPLTFSGENVLKKDIFFMDRTFHAGETVKSKYKFNSYRLIYAYSIVKNEDLQLDIGAATKIRDAEIALESSSGKASRTNFGSVPILLHLNLEWFFSRPFSFQLAGEGLAAPQGRAEDFMAALNFYVNRDFSLRVGYRILEGGASGGGNVYNFTLINYLLFGATYRF